MEDYWNNLEQCAGGGYAGFWFAVAIIGIGAFVFLLWLFSLTYHRITETDWYIKRQQAKWAKPKKYHPKWENFKDAANNIARNLTLGLVGLLGMMIGLYIIYGSYTTIACMIEMASQ